MDEGWHVAGMILTVQVAEKRKLAAHPRANPRPTGPLCYTPEQRRHYGNSHSIQPGPLCNIRS
jgi:hypothetical protein